MDSLLNKFLKISVYLIIILLPFTHKESFSLLLPDLIISKFALIALAGIGVVLFFRHYTLFKSDIFFGFLLINLIFSVFSIIQSQDLTSTISIVAYQLAILFAYPSVFWLIHRSQDVIRSIFDFYYLSLFCTFVFLILQIYMHETYGKAIGGIWPVPGFSTRYGSTFWDVNHYGAYIASATFLIFSGIVLTKSLTKKIGLIVILLFSLYALYLTSSRSAMIGFSTGLVVYFGLLFKKYINKPRQIDSLIQLLPFLIWMPLFITFILADYIKSAFLYRSVSFFSHMYLIKSGLEIGYSNFVFGIGANAFSDYFRNSKFSEAYFYIDPAAKSFKLPLHSLWLESFVETGVISFIFYLLFWLIAGLLSYKLYVKTKNLNILAFLSGLVTYLVGGFFYSYKNEFFWVYTLIGLSYVASSLYSANIIKIRGGLIFNMKKSVYYIFDGKFEIYKICYSIIATLVIIFPFLLILSPLTYSEVLYRDLVNASTNGYTIIYDMFRYVYGNYVFVIRIVNLILYTGVVLFSILNIKSIFKISFISSIYIVSIIFFILNIYKPVLFNGIFYYYMFLSLNVISILRLLLYYFKIEISKIDFRFYMSSTYKLYIMILILCLSFYYSSNTKNNLNKDLAFLLELSYNRGLFKDSLVYLNDDAIGKLYDYFCSDTLKNNSSYYERPCSYTRISDFQYTLLDNNNKKVLVILNSVKNFSAMPDKYKKDSNIIDLVDYKLLIYDPKPIN